MEIVNHHLVKQIYVQYKEGQIERVRSTNKEKYFTIGCMRPDRFYVLPLAVFPRLPYCAEQSVILFDILLTIRKHRIRD